jgi:hypothetical protein
MNILVNNSLFVLTVDNNTQNIYFNTHSIKKQYENQKNNNLNNEDKIICFNETVDYFYNFWIYINNESKLIYTNNFNIDLIEIDLPLNFYINVGIKLNQLRPIFDNYLSKSIIKVENDRVKKIMELFFTIYKSVKPIEII